MKRDIIKSFSIPEDEAFLCIDLLNCSADLVFAVDCLNRFDSFSVTIGVYNRNIGWYASERSLAFISGDICKMNLAPYTERVKSKIDSQRIMVIRVAGKDLKTLSIFDYKNSGIFKVQTNHL